MPDGREEEFSISKQYIEINEEEERKKHFAPKPEKADKPKLTEEEKNAMQDRIRMKIELEEQKYFHDDEKRRMRISKRNRSILAMVIVAFLMIVFSLFFSYVPNGGTNNMATYIHSITLRFEAFGNLLTGNIDTQGIQFSLVRILIIAIVGAALACCGTVYQGAFRNPIASPTTLGVQAGGSAAGVIYIIFFSGMATGSVNKFAHLGFISNYMQSFAILIGCFIGVTLIVSIATAAGRGKISTVALLLSGSIFGSFMGAGTGLLTYYMLTFYPEDPRINSLRTVMMGSFNSVITWQHLAMIGIPVCICLLIISLMRNNFNLLVFGEDEARAMGLRVGLFRNLTVALCTIMVAVTISFCGQIGFIGLIVPHIARLVVGPDFKGLIPASIFLGSAVMLFIYDIAVAVGYSVNMNVVTSAVGGIIFLLFLIIYRRKRNADWA